MGQSFCIIHLYYYFIPVPIDSVCVCVCKGGGELRAPLYFTFLMGMFLCGRG